MYKTAPRIWVLRVWWPVLGGTVWTVPPGTVHSTPEEDPRKVFIGGKWAVGTPGMECLSEGIQTHTPLKFRDPGPTQKLRFRGWKIILGV